MVATIFVFLGGDVRGQKSITFFPPIADKNENEHENNYQIIRRNSVGDNLGQV